MYQSIQTTLQVKKHKGYYKHFPDKGDIFFAACSDNHVRAHGGTLCDPLLKLFIGCPVMITQNLAVEEGIANGTMCEFVGLTLLDIGTPWNDQFEKYK